MPTKRETGRSSSLENDKHALFTSWAQEQGVKINGIKASEIPGKGVGIVAARDLKVCRMRLDWSPAD